MTFEPIVELGRVYSWDIFQRIVPQGSLALDGIVVAQTTFTETHGVVDHHLPKTIEDPSTCIQIYNLIRTGGFQKWLKGYVNHGDEDVCLSLFMLHDQDLVIKDSEDSPFHTLVHAEDLLDRNAGMYNLHNPELEEKISWIFEPYHTVRFNGTLPKLGAQGLREIIGEVQKRIQLYLSGQCQRVTLDRQYTELGHVGGYVIVDESGPAARLAMAHAGIKAFISLVGRTNGDYRYSLYRDSSLLTEVLSLSQLYEVFNAAEGILSISPQRWGGTNMRGGSPRGRESTLSPERIITILSSLSYH